MWWKITLGITLALIFILVVAYCIWACIRIGAKSENNYVLFISKSKHTPVRKRGEDDDKM